MKLRFLLPLMFCILPGQSQADTFSDRQKAHQQEYVAGEHQRIRNNYANGVVGFHRRLNKFASSRGGVTSGTCSVTALHCYDGLAYCSALGKKSEVGLGSVAGDVSVQYCNVTLGNGLACQVHPRWDIDRRPYREVLYSNCYDSNNRPSQYSTY